MNSSREERLPANHSSSEHSSSAFYASSQNKRKEETEKEAERDERKEKNGGAKQKSQKGKVRGGDAWEDLIGWLSFVRATLGRIWYNSWWDNSKKIYDVHFFSLLLVSFLKKRKIKTHTFFFFLCVLLCIPIALCGLRADCRGCLCFF